MDTWMLAQAIFYAGLGLYCFSVAMHILKFYLRRNRKKTGTTYGMVINSQTGKVSPQQRDLYE